MTSPSDHVTSPEDEACAAVWDQLARGLFSDHEPDEPQAWTQHQMNLIDAIFTALRLTRMERIRQQPVVSLADYRKAKEGR